MNTSIINTDEEMRRDHYTPELRREYNRIYYRDNRERVLNDLSKKVVCPFCKRKTSFGNLKKHQLTRLCMKNRPAEIVDEN